MKFVIWWIVETLWKKEKMLFSSIFSFSYIIFKSFSFPGFLKVGIVW